jgi:serine/threonine protein kinase
VIGNHINNYEVVSLLGEGGMGTVYLALHPIMGRKAAIKVLKPELARDESLVSRFFNEARAANAIRHPNIIDIIDVGLLPEGNVPYMLMEFLEGESLSSRLDRVRPLDVEQAVEIASQTASALAAAHTKGIVHRDLKPDNLFLVPDEMVGDGERVKVLDFGIAKLRDDMRGSSMKTRTGAIMGTAAYMSPEQCQGLIEKIDHRTDVYALGVILYEMLCGAPPFISEGFGDLIIMHVMREPEHPQLRNPSIPDHVAASILCALAKNPDQRFQSMADFQSAIRGQASFHGMAVPGLPRTERTAVMESQPDSPQQGTDLGFDVTLATPPPLSVKQSKPGSIPPSNIPTLLDQKHKAKQSTTTFRNATGEVEIADTALTSPSKRRAVFAVASIVALAAIALIVTVVVTRPTPSPPVPVESPTVAPATPFKPPIPDPDPIPELAKPKPFEPPPTATERSVEHDPPPIEKGKHVKKGKDGKSRKGFEKGFEKAPDKPSEKPTVRPPDPAPELTPPPKNTERW